MTPINPQTVHDRAHDHGKEAKRTLNAVSINLSLDSKLARFWFSFAAWRATKRKASKDAEDTHSE